MSLVLCSEVRDALEPGECTAVIVDVRGDSHPIRVARSHLDTFRGKPYLPVTKVADDHFGRAVLVELPHEADGGAHRVRVLPSHYTQYRGRAADPIAALRRIAAECPDAWAGVDVPAIIARMRDCEPEHITNPSTNPESGVA